MKEPKRKRRAKPTRTYHFNVRCSFALQFSFAESEIEQDPEGHIGDSKPTDKALRRLAKELTDALGANYGIEDVQADADSDDLLGVIDE